MTLLDTIKRAGLVAVNSENPVNLLFGEVIEKDPLVIKVDQRFDLTADFLIVPESLTPLEINLQHEHQYQDASESGTSTRTTQAALNEPIVIRRGLEIGDRLILLRVQGGQKYLILDRVVVG